MKTLKVEYSEVTKNHETQTKNDEEKRKELQELHESEIKKIEQKFAELNQQHEENIKSYNEKYEEVLKKYEEQVELEEKKRQEILNKTGDQINKLKENFEEIINQQNKIIEEQKTVIQSIQDNFYAFILSGKLEVFKYEKGKEFEGIMRNLSNKIGGKNIHENWIIQITSNTQYLDYKPQNALDFDNDNYYFSNDILDSIVYFDFRNKSVCLTNYSIKKQSGLRNWVIEASNDEKLWEKIDEHKNDSSLNKNEYYTFDIQKKNNAFFRFIRIRQTGDSWYSNSGSYYFGIKKIEFFGAIKE